MGRFASLFLRRGLRGTLGKTSWILVLVYLRRTTDAAHVGEPITMNVQVKIPESSTLFGTGSVFHRAWKNQSPPSQSVTCFVACQGHLHMA